MRALYLLAAFLFLAFVQLNAQWYEQNSGTNERLNSVFFIDETTGWACGFNGKIIKTTDGGFNWFSQNSDPSKFLSKIQFINSSIGWAGGGNELLSTTNGGNSWNVHTFEDSAHFYNFKFVNINTGWIVVNYENSSRILRTTNGGSNWESQLEIATPSVLTDIFFLDENNGWVSSDLMGIFKTTDGGTNWAYHQTNFNGYPQQIAFINPVLGWISSNTSGGVQLFKTTDGGSDWTIQYSNINTTIYSISFLNDETGYAAGYKLPMPYWLTSFVMMTTNGGIDWQEQYVDNSILHSIYFVNDNAGWAVGNSGKIIHTDNGGSPDNQVSFSEDSIYIPTLADSGSTKIVNSSDYPVRIDSIISVGSFYGYRGEFSKTGYQLPFYLFQNLPSPQWNDTLGIIIPPHDSITVSFYDVDLCPICDYEVQEYFKDTLRFVFSFLDGVSYSFSNSIQISGEGHPSDVTDKNVFPNELVLYQNYPNPFNPSTSIQYAIGSKQFVSIKIYDVLGNEVAKLVDEERPAGSYEVEFNASNLPAGRRGLSSGVYYYQLRVGTYIETKKMIYLK